MSRHGTKPYCLKSELVPYSDVDCIFDAIIDKDEMEMFKWVLQVKIIFVKDNCYLADLFDGKSNCAWFYFVDRIFYIKSVA